MNLRRLVIGEMRRDSDNKHAQFGPLIIDGVDPLTEVQEQIEQARQAEGITYNVRAVMILDLIGGEVLYLESNAS